jgi:hypothetical protein
MRQPLYKRVFRFADRDALTDAMLLSGELKDPGRPGFDEYRLDVPVRTTTGAVRLAQALVTEGIPFSVGPYEYDGDDDGDKE